MAKFNPWDRQSEIYIKGLGGEKPLIPLNAEQLRKAAKVRMSEEGYAYVAGGAGVEDTVDRNRSAFNNWQIIPRMLNDVSSRDISIELFGQKLPAPLLLSPVGVLELARKNGDILTAKGAANMGVPMIFSNQASASMEDMAAQMGNSPRWFQMYWSKSNDLVASLAERAEKSGCAAIAVTLDTTMLGWRIRDLDLAYLPFLKAKGIAQYTSDPVFRKLMEEEMEDPAFKPKTNLKTIWHLLSLARNFEGGFFKNLKTQTPLKAVRTFVNIYSRPSLRWEDLAFLRKQTKLPIVLKGILHPNDARKALDYGVDGIIVSNHGGRQVDGAVSTIESLPGVVDAVDGAVPVLMDSGVRGGADMFKAIALGAKAVCIGRPFVYGLALEGSRGVEEVLKNYITDFDLTMGLSGCKNISEINRSCLKVNNYDVCFEKYG